MNTYDGHDNEGRLVYFEIPNALLSRRAACRLVAAIPNIQVTYRQHPFSFFGEDIFCRFELGGKQFEMWEPFGDNSRFHVATQPLEACAELETLKNVFANHRSIAGYLPWLFLIGAIAYSIYRWYFSCIAECK